MNCRPSHNALHICFGGVREGVVNEQAGLRVLLVEDDGLVAGPVEEELAEAGCPVISTPYGARALALSRNFAFDAAIVNLRLPDMDAL